MPPLPHLWGEGSRRKPAALTERLAITLPASALVPSIMPTWPFPVHNALTPCLSAIVTRSRRCLGAKSVEHILDPPIYAGHVRPGWPPSSRSLPLVAPLPDPGPQHVFPAELQHTPAHPAAKTGQPRGQNRPPPSRRPGKEQDVACGQQKGVHTHHRSPTVRGFSQNHCLAAPSRYPQLMDWLVPRLLQRHELHQSAVLTHSALELQQLQSPEESHADTANDSPKEPPKEPALNSSAARRLPSE